MRLRSFFTALGLIALATSCNDTMRSPTAPAINGPAPALSSAPGDRIGALIDSIFPKGNAQAAHSRWDNVTRQLTRGTGPSSAAKSQYVNLVQWLQSKTSEVTPPAGETAAHVVARLVLYMSVYVYGGPDAQAPPMPPTADAVLGVVDPAATTPTTIQTPTQHAGVQFPPGSVAEATVMVIVLDASKYPDNCSGPLVTHLCQYPQFYQFNAFPDVRLQKPAAVAVCHVDAGSTRRPLADHDRFRLAHDKPVNPADYAPNSVIVDSVEIFELHVFANLINCQPNSYGLIDRPTSGPTLGPWDRWLNRGLNAAAHLASAVGGLISPKDLYAIDQGGGGFTLEFSTFGDIDPQSVPDLRMTSPLNVSPVSAFPGDTISVGSWTYTNGGSNTAPSATSTLVLASDSTLSAGVVTLATFGQSTPLPPQQQSITVPPQKVVIPKGTPAGKYYLGALLDPANTFTDSTRANNYFSVGLQVIVMRQAFRVCPTEPATAGTVATIAQALPNTADGGTISLCDGTHTVYDVAITRPVTITSAGPGIATIDADTAQQALLLGGSTGTVKLHKLKFAHGINAAVDITGKYGSIVIDSSEFDPMSGTATAHAGININSAAGGGILVRGNSFVSGDVGIHAAGTSGVTIRRNVFSGQGNTGLLVNDGSAAGALVVDSSRFTACARVSCVNAVGISAASLTFAADTFLVDISHQVGYAIRDSMPHGTLVATDNVITATGNSGTDRTLPAAYPVDTSAFRVAGNATLLRNKITNTARVFQFTDDGTSATGSDNVTQHVGGLFREVLPSTASLTLKMTRNDFNDYTYVLGGNGTAATTIDLRCNYWGGPAPHNTGRTTQVAVLYTPWSTQPIAGTTTACDPTAQYTTVRACPAASSTTPTLATIVDALTVVPDNGTVLVCDGTFSVSGQGVVHPLTLAAEDAGLPTFDGGTRASPILFTQFPSGNLTIRGLKFVNGGASQIIVGNAFTGTLVIDKDEFHPTATGSYATPPSSTSLAGVQAYGTFGNITVSNSSFIGGDEGVSFNGNNGAGGTMTILNNHFTGQDNFAIRWSSASPVPPPTPNMLAHIEGNTFDTCPRQSCLRVNSATGGTVQIVNNQFTADPTHQTRIALELLNATSGTVDHNSIVGSALGADHTQASSYPFDVAAIQSQSMPLTVTHNTVSNAWAAVNVSSANVTGNDNVAAHVGYPVTSFSSTTSQLSLVRNDFTDYLSPTPNPLQLPGANLRCNYWGPGGPVNPATAGSINYLPFANQPIANTSASCDPTVGVTTVHLCATPASDGSPTSNSLFYAYALVPAGGTISVCDGTYPVTQTLNIQKSVTITGEGTTVPTLDGGLAGTQQSIIGIFSTGANVTLRQLKFQNSTGHNVQVNGATGAIVVDHSEFHPPQSFAYNSNLSSYQENYSAGIGAFGNVTSLLVTNSQFIGGDIGVHINTSTSSGPSSIVARGSHFTGQTNAGFFVGGSTASLVARAEADTFDVCGRRGCSKFFANNGGRGEWVNNRFNVDISHPVLNAINIYPGTSAPISTLIDHNVITGTGGSGDPAASGTYPIDGFAINGTGNTSTVTSNTIVNAWAAFSTTPGTTTATDNVASHVYTLIGSGGPGSINLVLNRNDVSDYSQVLFSNQYFASIDLRCNYWGSSAGPNNPGNYINPTPQYLPWSNMPIANNPGVTCNPSAATNTIRVCATPATDGSMTTNSLLNAYLLVPAGGTVSVCNGTYPVTSPLNIQKSVTIAGEGTAVPTLDGGGSAAQIINIYGTPANVTLRQLRFQNTTGNNVSIGSTTGAIVIDNSEFHPFTTYPYRVDTTGYREAYQAGVGAYTSFSSLTVTNSQFIGGDIGVNAYEDASGAAGTLLVRNNHFTGQSNAGLFVAGSGSQLTTHAEANTFDSCGRIGCLKFYPNAGRGEFVNNRFNVDISHPVQNVVNFAYGANSATSLVDQNQIVGTGGGGDRTQHSTYPIDGFAVSGNANTATVTRNVITNAYSPFNFFIGSITATDNTASHVYTAVGGGWPSPAINLAFNRNDLSDYTQATFGTYGFVSMDLRCNYWGAATGPVNPGNYTNPSPQYLPWSTVPIANNPSVTCNPNSATNTLRVCPTVSATDPLTTTDAQTAYNILPSGGTMSFCAGRFTLNGLYVTKPMTFQSDGSGTATLVAAAGAPNAIGIGAANGVTIRGLSFQGGVYSNIAVNNATGPVLIDASQFAPPQTQAYASGTLGYSSGVFVGSGNTAPVTVQNSTFTGGDIGAMWDQVSNVTIHGNTFTGQTNAGTHGGNGPSANIVIDGNSYTDCGLNWCIGVFNANGVAVTNNQFTINPTRPTQSPINTYMNPSGTVTVTGNTITGGGSPGSFYSPSSFPVSNAVNIVNATGTVTGNHFGNAWNGIVLNNSNGSGTDNVMNHVGLPFLGIGSGIGATFTRNDVVDYSSEIGNYPAFGPLNLHCNWWGSPTGPVNSASLPTSIFNPFATAPIANQPSVSCTP